MWPAAGVKGLVNCPVQVVGGIKMPVPLIVSNLILIVCIHLLRHLFSLLLLHLPAEIPPSLSSIKSKEENFHNGHQVYLILIEQLTCVI